MEREPRPVTERSQSLDSEASATEHRPSPGDSSQSSMSPKDVEVLYSELAQELKDQGWRVGWSKSFRRPYYYNFYTNESSWDPPPLDISDPLTDPLGINWPMPQQPEMNLRESRGSSDLAPPLKRSHSADEHCLPPAKRPNLDYRPYWNFKIPSGVLMYERRPLHMPRCHPDVEILRSMCVQKLRAKLQEMCQAREGFLSPGISAPHNGFLRWILERKITDKGIDPVLPSKCEDDFSQTLAREIKNDIPIKLITPKYASEARKQLLRYGEGARAFIEKRGKSSEDRKKVIFRVEETFQWARVDQNASYDKYQYRLGFLKRECQPAITAAAEESVKAICRKLQACSGEYANEIYEFYKKLSAEQGQQIPGPWPSPKEMKRECYPIYLSYPSLRMPHVMVDKSEQKISFTYNNQTVTISRPYVNKLEQLYSIYQPEDDLKSFPARAFCMLLRYNTLFGPSEGEAAHLQAALPTPVFECLERVFGVTFECFASPLNCYFRQYCSAFPDTDAYFGSRGSILDFHPLRGSFEANPPWCEELIENMLSHFEHLLATREEPLSFIVFLPDHRDPPPNFLIRAETSSFTRKTMVLTPYEHEYRDGLHYLGGNKSARCSHGTAVSFMQNDAGYMKWGPMPERMNELLRASLVRSTNS